METCEVTFDETQPCNSSVFECAGDDEGCKKIFEGEEDDAGEDDGDDGEAAATHVPSTSTTTKPTCYLVEKPKILFATKALHVPCLTCKS
jgi:hypothetical protein